MEQFDNFGVLSACDLIFWFSDRLLNKYTPLLLIDGPQPKHFCEQLTPPFPNSHRPPNAICFCGRNDEGFVYQEAIYIEAIH